MKTGVFCDVGKTRKVNEDGYYISKCDKNNALVIVADGMGGHKGGKIASSLAIEMISKMIDFKKVVDFSIDEIENVLVESIKETNDYILSKSLSDDDLLGMGTTVVVCIILNDNVYIANVGDSRLYAIRQDKIAQITKDHSVVQELVDRGEITKKEAKDHPNKNLITRAVGSDIKIEVDTYYYKTQKDDYLILCTDGLTNMVDDNVILNCVTNEKDLQIAVDKLGNMANENGGYDNITIVAVKFE